MQENKGLELEDIEAVAEALKEDTDGEKDSGEKDGRYMDDAFAGKSSYDLLVDDMKKYPVLSHEECIGLVKRAQEGDAAAREKLINSNLRLVIKVAKRYVGYGLDLEDLIQEGCMGLMRSIDQFDISKGFHFSTYATWWIRQGIARGLANGGRSIRLPVHVIEKMAKIKKAERDFVIEHHRAPTDAETAEIVGLTERQVRDVKECTVITASLDAPVGEDQDDTLGAFIVDTKEQSPEDSAVAGTLKDIMEEVMKDLKPKERDVIRLRFGFEDGRVYTLEEVGNMYGVTRERIRQIEEKALIKLRNPRRSRLLRDYATHSIY